MRLGAAALLTCLAGLVMAPGLAQARSVEGWRGRKVVDEEGRPRPKVKGGGGGRSSRMAEADKKKKAKAKKKSTSTSTKRGRTACTSILSKAKVPWAVASARPGVREPIEVRGPIAGVEYYTDNSRKAPLVLDCALVEALLEAGPIFRDEGIRRARYSASYQVRNIRGTSKRSKHSYGLALDVHSFEDDDGEKLSVLDDYEQGLGDDVDCIGEPDTEAARSLRTLYCRFIRGTIFHLVLGPDDNADHHNHFHLEAPPWGERKAPRREPVVAPTEPRELPEPGDASDASNASNASNG